MAIKSENKINKICSIIRTYLLFNKEVSANELADFMNFNGFNMGQGVNANEIARIIKVNKKKNGILKDIEMIKKNTIYYYYIKKR